MRTILAIVLCLVAVDAVAQIDTSQQVQIPSGGSTFNLRSQQGVNAGGTTINEESFTLTGSDVNGVAQRKNTLGPMAPTPTGTPGAGPTVTLKPCMPDLTPTPAEFCMICSEPTNIANIDVKAQFGDTLSVSPDSCSPPYPSRNTAGITQGGAWPTPGYPGSCLYLQCRGSAGGDGWTVVSW